MSDEMFIPDSVPTTALPSRKLLYVGMAVGSLFIAIVILLFFVFLRQAPPVEETTTIATTTSKSSVDDTVSKIRPNIVVIMTDDQDDQGSMQFMPKTTDLLTKKGVLFKNSFVNFPLCCPSRASFLTGQYVHNNGVKGNSPALDGGYDTLIPTEGNTLPVWLQNAGYTTAHIGKYLNGIESHGTKIPLGWTYWNGLIETYKYYKYIINDNGVAVTYGSAPKDYQTDVLAERAERFIETQASSSKPFFLWLAPLAPHTGRGGDERINTKNHLIRLTLLPVPAPRDIHTLDTLALPSKPSFNEPDISDKPKFVQNSYPIMDSTEVQYALDSYRRRMESLGAVDDMVEKVVMTLKRAGLIENTIIVFTSDNGYFHGEHRRPNGKDLIYEESIRVPLIIRGPYVPEGETRTQLVNNLDVVATILAKAKATPGRTLDGISLESVIKSTNAPWRSALLIEGFMGNNKGKKRYNAIRTDVYKFVEYYPLKGTPTVEATDLYNLSLDPYELESIHGNTTDTAVKHWLKNSLQTLKTCAGTSCFISETPPLSSPTSSAGANPPVVAGAYTDALAEDDASSEQEEIELSFLSGVTLHVGSSGEDIRRLQLFLAQDPQLYPEGIISGIFDEPTRQAVIRFQELYRESILEPLGLTSGSGIAGQATIEKINALIAYYELLEEYDE